MRITVLAVGALAFGLGNAAMAGDKANFDVAAFESSFNAAFQNKDANAVAGHLASLYNEGGVSRQEMVRQLNELFQKADVNVSFHFSDFQPIPGTRLAHVKIVSKMNAHPIHVAQAGESSTVLASNEERTMRGSGFATLAYEKGEGGYRWRLVTTDTGCTGSGGNNAAFLGGDGWGSQINPAAFTPDLLSPSNKPVFQGSAHQQVFQSPEGKLPAFDVKKWENGFREAWNSKDLARIMSYYSSNFTTMGMDHSQIRQGFQKMLQEYDRIHCDYKVIGVRFPSGAPTASLKAVLELRGAKKGSDTFETLLQAAGTASLIVEKGTWRAYATQPLSSSDIGEHEYKVAMAAITGTGDSSPQQ